MAKNICGKTRNIRKGEQPYITWTDPRSGWKYKLLKTYVTNDHQPYARWFVDVEGFGHDIGDEYAANLIPGLFKVVAAKIRNPETELTWDRGVWPTISDLAQWLVPTLKK